MWPLLLEITFVLSLDFHRLGVTVSLVFIFNCLYHHRLLILNIYCNMCFRDVTPGDVVTVGECRPLSKTVRFNVLKVAKGPGSSGKKSFSKF